MVVSDSFLESFDGVFVAGAGNLGSNLVYSLSFTPLNNILIMDNDILNEPNLPYVTASRELAEEHFWIGSPKTMVLECIIRDINPSVNVVGMFTTLENQKLENCSLKIDCRDSFSSTIPFHIKLCLDMNIGRIIINPYYYKNEKAISKYTKRPDRFVTNMFVNDIIKLLVLDNEFRRNVYELYGTNKTRELFFNYNDNGRQFEIERIISDDTTVSIGQKD